MQYNNLGRSGLRVSQLSYGAWVTFGNQLDVKEAKSLLQACRDAGVNFFDNAEVYANGRAEEIMGQAIRDLGWRRADVVISTKLFWGGQGPNDKGLSRKHIVEGLKASLKRLDMEYVDVVYAHRPDATTPIEETVRAMNWVIGVLTKQPELVGEKTPLRDLIARLLEKDPARRIGARGIKAHPFFHGVDWDRILRVARPPYIPALPHDEDAGEVLDVEKVVHETFAAGDVDNAAAAAAGDDDKKPPPETGTGGGDDGERRVDPSKDGDFSVFF